MNKEGWTYKKFEDIMSPAKVERCGGRTDLPILSITMHNGIVGQNDRFKKVIASRDKSNYKIVKNGQLVIAFPIDEGLIYTQDVAPIGIMSPAYNIWNVDYSQVDRHFIVRYFHSQYAFSYYKAKLRATTQRRRTMDRSDLLSMPIPVPPLPVQQRIVSELDLLSNIIVMKRKQVEEYDALTQSVFYEMFESEIASANKENFNQCFKLNSGDSLPARNIQAGPYPVYGGNGVMGYHNNFNLDGNNIIIGRVGALCGNVRLVQGKIFVSDNAFILTDKRGFDICFLSYYLKILNLRQYAREAMQPVISNLSLKNIKIFFPPLPLQHAFADKVRAIERQKQLVNDSIRELQTLLDSRMQEYFG